MTTFNRTVLETLIDTVYDSVEGYRKASETADSQAIKTALADQLALRQKTLDSLNAELVRLGGSLVTKGTLSGALHRTWMDIADLFFSGDETAVEHVSEGETYLAKKFEEALEHTDLDPHTRSVIEAAHRDIVQGEQLAERLEARID